MQQINFDDVPAFSSWREWRELAPRPADPNTAVAMLLGVKVAERTRRRDDENHD